METSNHSLDSFWKRLCSLSSWLFSCVTRECAVSDSLAVFVGTFPTTIGNHTHTEKKIPCQLTFAWMFSK